MSKLTLSADPALVHMAKAVARAEHTSVSALFERFVRLLALERSTPTQLPPGTQDAIGVISCGDVDSRVLLADALLDRHQLQQPR